jgi:hypothetical protein
MVPATQIIPTSRIAFAMTMLGSAAGATWALCAAMWDATSLEAAMLSGLQMIPPAMIAALIGAAAGAILALLFGANLSRQYCWLFCVTAGLVGIPVLAMSVGFLKIAFEADRWLPQQFQSFEWQLYPIFAPVVAGLLVAVLTTRTRIGLTRRSRRAAWTGMIIGVIACAIIEFIYWRAMLRMNVNIFAMGPGSSNIQWLVVTPSLFALVGAGAAAAWFAERPTETRYEVLPVTVASIPKQT